MTGTSARNWEWTARQIGDALRVLVIRLSGNVEDAARGGEAPQLLLDGSPGGEVGGVADTGRAGQDTGDEGSLHDI